MILVVDSDPGDSSSLERVLRYNGFEAVTVMGGMEALALLELQMPQLIILDLQIKDLNGIALIRAIRADPEVAGLPILVFTREFAHELRQEALRAGAQDYLVKGT